jgi:hypothetical protein
MPKKITTLLALMLALVPASTCVADFKTFAGWGEQVFPSYLISTAAMKNQVEEDEATLGDPLGAFGVEVTATDDDQPIKVTVICDGFAESSEYVGTLSVSGNVYRVFPKMRYKFEKLSQYRQATPSSVTFRVQLGDEVPEEKTVTITMRSINDCAFMLVEGDSVIEMNYCFAAYVNEQHPFVDKLLREALDIGVIDSFTGYQSGDPDKVLAQVYAIWDLMANRDVRYSSITATAALSQSTRSQHVRLLEETINNTQANCVDGTVLFASILKKIGIDSALVITKDHCYLAFWADRERKMLYGLETTMVSANFEDETIPDVYDSAVPEESRWEYSWGSFVNAMQVGSRNLQQELKKEKSEIALIDVASARLAGVLPIPFHSSEEFLAHQYEYADGEMSEEATLEGESSEEEYATEDVDESEEEEGMEEREVIAAGDQDVEWEDEKESGKKQRRSRRQAADEVEWE